VHEDSFVVACHIRYETGGIPGTEDVTRSRVSMYAENSRVMEAIGLQEAAHPSMGNCGPITTGLQGPARTLTPIASRPGQTAEPEGHISSGAEFEVGA
jgi:hypothetical protein